MVRDLLAKSLVCLAIVTSASLSVPLQAQECCSDLISRLQAALNEHGDEKPQQVLADHGWRKCCGNSIEQERHIVDMVLDKWRDAKEISYDEREVLNLLPFVLNGEQGAKLLMDGMISRGMWDAWAASESPSFDDLPENSRQHYIEVMLSAISGGKINQTYEPSAKETMAAVIAVYPSEPGLKALTAFFRERPQKSLVVMDLVVASYKLGKKLSHADMKLIFEKQGSNRVFDLWFLSGAEKLLDKRDALKLKGVQKKAREDYSSERIVPIEDYIELSFKTVRQETKGSPNK
jgi:hypothetical protein